MAEVYAYACTLGLRHGCALVDAAGRHARTHGCMDDRVFTLDSEALRGDIGNSTSGSSSAEDLSVPLPK